MANPAYQHVYEGAGAPATAPGSIGAHYTDTSTGDQYLAKGTASAADWVLQEKGGAAAAAVQAHTEAADPHPQYAAAGAPATAAAAAVDAHNLAADPHTQYQQKEAGKGLSTNDYTTEEKSKLAGLEGSHFKGLHLDLAALQAAVVSPVAGDYADVDAGVGAEVVRHLWDASDAAWKPQLGASAQLTAAQIKTEYESNADTNAFSDADKAKLAGLAATAIVETATDLTVDASHNGNIIAVNSAADVVVTIAAHATSAWPVGASFRVTQLGTGGVKIAGAAGVTVRRPKSKDPVVAERYGTVTVQRYSQNVWQLAYDLADHVLGYKLAILMTSTHGVGIADGPGATQLTTLISGLWADRSPASITYSHDGSMLAFGTSNRLFVVDTDTGAVLLEKPAALGCISIAFSHDGSKLAVGYGDSPYFEVLNTSDWLRVAGSTGSYFTISKAVRSIDWSHDDSKIAVVAVSGHTLKIINATNWTTLATPVQAPSTPAPIEARWNHDSSILAVVGTASPYIELFDASDLTFATKLATPVDLPTGGGISCKFSPDGSMLAVGHNSTPFLTIYTTSDWVKMADPAVIPINPVSKLEFSPDGAELALKQSGVSGAVTRYKTSDWSQDLGLVPPDTYWGYLAYSPLY